MGKKKENNEALINACNFCTYPASRIDKTISIPQDELEIGSEDLSVRYLIATYGFKIQSAIGSVTKKEHFDPELKEKREVVKSGLTYKRVENGFLYRVMTDPDIDGFVTIRDVDGKQKDKQYLAEDILKLLKNGKYQVTKQV